jgi:hypothetical protein
VLGFAAPIPVVWLHPVVSFRSAQIRSLNRTPAGEEEAALDVNGGDLVGGRRGLHHSGARPNRRDRGQPPTAGLGAALVAAHRASTSPALGTHSTSSATKARRRCTRRRKHHESATSDGLHGLRARGGERRACQGGRPAASLRDPGPSDPSLPSASGLPRDARRPAERSRRWRRHRPTRCTEGRGRSTIETLRAAVVPAQNP